MSKSRMRGHFRYLRFKTFPMTPRTPQCEVFFPLLWSSKHSGVPEDSNSRLFQVLGFTPTLGQSRVATPTLSQLTSNPSNLLQESHSTSFLFPSIKTNQFFLPQEACWNKYPRLNWKLCPGKKKAPNDLSPRFKEKEKRREGRSKVWWPMECSNTWWPMECSIAWWPMECEGKTPFHFFPLSPNKLA